MSFRHCASAEGREEEEEQEEEDPLFLSNYKFVDARRGESNRISRCFQVSIVFGVDNCEMDLENQVFK